MALADEIRNANEREKIRQWDAAEQRLATELGLGPPAEPLSADIRASLDSFNRYASAKGCRCLPAKPWVIAGFCLDASSMGVPWPTIVKALKAITAAHDHHHLADPCTTSIVRGTVEKITPPIEPPRSWNKDEKAAWRALPPDVRQAITRRENDRDKELRKLQNKAATNGAAKKPVEAKTEELQNDSQA